MLFRTVGIVIGLAASILAQTVAKPSEDPFYIPGKGYKSTAPGAILKSRKVNPGLFGFNSSVVTTYQLLYRTTSVNGTPIATVTTVFRPLASTTALDRFISYQTAEDSSYINCSPSYNFQLAANNTNSIITLEAGLIGSFVNQGFVVSSPDYESYDSAFAAGRLAGQGVLDSMRAVNNFAATLGLKSKKNSIVGVGYSGGAIATGWAAALQGNYAPELNVKGWSAGGTPANLTATALYLDGKFYSGFIPTAVVGLSTPNAYGAQLQPIVKSIITPNGTAVLDFAKTHCGLDVVITYPNLSLQSKVFQKLGDRLYYQPTIAAVLANNTLGVRASEAPRAPVNLYHAVPDEIIPYADAEALYKRWCAQGATVRFTSYKSGNHISAELNHINDVNQFVVDAFAGKVAQGCQAITMD